MKAARSEAHRGLHLRRCFALRHMPSRWHLTRFPPHISLLTNPPEILHLPLPVASGKEATAKDRAACPWRTAARREHIQKGWSNEES